MYLKKMIYVNWGNIPQMEVEFGRVNLFSGGNGSGKTTAADGIQTLMTAAHENLFNYNPGQDETTQRGRGGKQVRTLASYVLGCDDGSYARPQQTDAYLIGVFTPSAGEQGEEFSVVLAARAHLDSAGQQRQARQDQLLFLCVPGETLRLDQFVRQYQDGKHVVPMTDVVDLLRREYHKAAIEVYDKKGAYLRRLYGLLRGRKDAVTDREAKHAARTFANFMAYKPVKSINEFVADEILERKDLGEAIRTVSDLMKTIHGMEEESRSIIQSLDILERSREACRTYTDAWIQRQVLHYQDSQRQLQVKQRAYVTSRKKQASLLDELKERDNRLEVNKARRVETHDEIVALEAQRRGVLVLNEKDELTRQVERMQQELAQKAQPLLTQDHQINDNIRFANSLAGLLAQQSWGAELPALEAKSLREKLKNVIQSGHSAKVDLAGLFGKDWVDLAPLESSLDQAIEVEKLHNQLCAELQGSLDDGKPSLRDLVSQLRADTERNLQARRKQLQVKEREISQLEARQVGYPAHVEVALAAIREQCPKAEPRVLCDYVEVLDSDWQMAIEGYLGGARFGIVVAPEYEAEAISIVRNLAGRRSAARVVQGARAERDAARLSNSADSIVEILSFQHKTVEYYLKASYGNVVRVDNAQDLKNVARGITREGLAAGNYSLWRCDIPDSELVFGQFALDRASAAKQNEYNELLKQAHAAQEQLAGIQQLLKAIESIRRIDYATLMQGILVLHRKLRQTEKTLADLDAGEFKVLDQELLTLQEKYAALEADLKQLENEKGRLAQEYDAEQVLCRKIADDQDKLTEIAEDREMSVRGIAKLYPQFDAEAALKQADETLVVNDQNFYQDEIQQYDRILTGSANELYETLLRHNQHCNAADTVIYDPQVETLHKSVFFKRINEVYQEVDNISNRLKNNVLVEKYEQLAKLKDRFNETFVSHLCHSIYQAINEGERALTDLNRELESHRFGTDRERFYFAWNWVPEFKEYWRFFKEVSRLPNVGDGSSLFDMDVPKALLSVRDKLVSMLLDEDEQKAMRELQRIADYRNYRSYDIYKEPEGKQPIALSQYGTGSGGQLETPAYIIRSAAVTSAFRFNEGSTHLRMVLVDEAFSKMDETRSREVINYLTDALGLQLLFIMPTSKSGPFMDVISHQTVFTKCPSGKKVGELNTRVLVDRKRCNQDKIAQLWEQSRQKIRDQATLDFMEGIS